MLKIDVAGSPSEMGFAQGEKTVDRWLDLVEARRPVRVAEKLQADVEKHLPRQMQRILGLAKGAAVMVEKIMAELFIEALSAKADYYVAGCSAVGLRGKTILFDGPVIGKNIDAPIEQSSAYLVRESRPSDAFRSIEIAFGPWAGAIDGLNEKGLAIAYDIAHSIDNPDCLVPLSLIVQEAFERCATVEDAIKIFTEIPRANSAIIMLADKSGDMASVELSPDHYAVRRPDGDRIAHTNHYHTPGMTSIEIPVDAIYSDAMPQGLRGMRILESSRERYARIARLISETSQFDEKGLAAILEDHDEDGVPDDNTVCRHGSFFATVVSTILNPASRTIKAAQGFPCAADYETFSIA